MALPRDAWTQARDRFLEDLEEPERHLFAEASLENIFYSASAAQKANQDKSKSRRLASKLDALLAGIHQYGMAMDILSQASPFLCPLWGALRVVIHLSSLFQKYFTALIDMFEQIGDVIPRFQAYEKLFSSSPRLMQSLSNAYLDVAKFCTNAKAAFQNARNSVVNAKILLKVSWKSVEQQFGTLMKDFRRHRKSVEKEAELSHLLEAERARAVERANIIQQEKQESEVERIRLLSLLSTVQWRQQHQRILDMRYPGTGTWILTKDVFEQWKTTIVTPQQRCLWCYGIPGSGKTVLTASVIESLSQEVDRQNSDLAYFYYDFTDQETLDDSIILGTIIQQLLVSRQGLEDVVAAKILEAYTDSLRKASSTDLVEVLELIILDSYHCVYIVVDGVDEASASTQEKLFSNLAKLSASCGTLLRLYISTRETFLMPHHFPSCLTFDVSESRVSEDIEHYIESSVQQRLHNLPVISNYPYLEGSAVRELTAKAKGLFLWVSLQIEELCDPSHSEGSFIDALEDLPEGLTAIYERICENIARLPSRHRALADRIFNWTICARRPLKFEELKDAIAVDLDDTSWDRKKIPAETNGKRFLQVCRNLAIFHERDSTVRLAHHTVEKFLLQHKKNRSQTDAKIGAICLTYLNFSDFETQMIPVRTKHDILKAKFSRQSSFYRIPETLGIRNVVYDLIVRYYDWNSKSSLPYVNYSELTTRYNKKPLPESLAQKYYLLDYITANWIWHAKSFDHEIPEYWSRFRNFVFNKVLPFDFKPWGTLEGPSHLPHLALYLWAIESNHLPVLLLLRDFLKPNSLKPYLEYKTLLRDQIPQHLLTSSVRTQTLAINFHENPDAYDWPTMRILLEGTAEMREFCLQEDPSIISYRHIMTRALRDTNLGLMKILLEGGKELHKSEIDVSNALHASSRRGDTEFTKLLLGLGANANSRLFHDERGRTPLYEVIMKGLSADDDCHESRLNDTCSSSPLEMIELLLDSGADPNAKQTGGETALHKAISLGESYVRLLLSRGADVDARNDQQQSILDLAVDASSRMIDILVEYDVDLEAEDSYGRTALLKTAEKGPEAASRMEILIGHGADVNAKDIWGQTALLKIAQKRPKAASTMETLIRHGADVNAKHIHGQTALLKAVTVIFNQHSKACIRTLIAHGADVNAKDVKGRTALLNAVTYDPHNAACVRILIEYGADVNGTDIDGQTALLKAVTYHPHDATVVRTLIVHGADVNARDVDGRTILHHLHNSTDGTLRHLLELGMDVNAKDDNGERPMDFAVRQSDNAKYKLLLDFGGVPGEGTTPVLTEAAARGNTELVNLLLCKGFDPNTLGNGKWSALSSAVWNNHKETATALLAKGADANLTDGSNVTPLSRAIMNRKKGIALMLIEAGAVIQLPDDNPFSPLNTAIRYGGVEMVKFLVQQGADISRFRPVDLSLGSKDKAMCDYLTRLGVPFNEHDDDDDDDDDDLGMGLGFS